MPHRILAFALALTACTPAPRTRPAGVPVQLLPLEGPLAVPEAEISAMAWRGDTLVLVPQYPQRFGDVLFALDKVELLARVDGPHPPRPLRPRTIAFEDDGLARLPGYEGLEAIAFDGDRVYLLVETSPRAMRAFVAAGEVMDGGARVRVRSASAVPIEPPVALDNMSHEALVVRDGRLLAFFEANGPAINPSPRAALFDGDLHPLGDVPFPPLDFRVADATVPDADGRFWVSNLFYIGDRKLRAASRTSVEQLVELQWTPSGVARTKTPPLVLQRIDDQTTRNWEGLVRLDDRGFLLATDTYPETLLGFVRHP